MLPSLDRVTQSIAHLKAASWPVKIGVAAGLVAAGSLAWPAMVGAGYSFVVWSRLRSAKGRYALVSLMAVSCLMAQGAWSRWMVAGLVNHPTAVAVNSQIQTADQSTGEVAGAETSSQPQQVTIGRVVDGAHVEAMVNGESQIVTLIGLKAPDAGTGATPPACYGQESKQYLAGLIGSGQVQLAVDSQLTDRDTDGHLLRYLVGADGSLINRQMLDAGMVEEAGGAGYTQKVTFLAAQEAAKNDRRGLWAACQVDTSPTPSPTEDGASPTPTTTPSPTVNAHLVKPVIPTEEQTNVSSGSPTVLVTPAPATPTPIMSPPTTPSTAETPSPTPS